MKKEPFITKQDLYDFYLRDPVGQLTLLITIFGSIAIIGATWLAI